MAEHVTAADLGTNTSDIDVAAYNAALDYIDDDQGEWLWSDGDFYLRLRVVCGQIMAADSDSPNATPKMREAAAEFIRYYDTA